MSKRVRKEKSFGSNLYVYLVEGSRESIAREITNCYNVDDYPKNKFDEAIRSPNAVFWKEAIQYEIFSK